MSLSAGSPQNTFRLNYETQTRKQTHAKQHKNSLICWPSAVRLQLGAGHVLLFTGKHKSAVQNSCDSEEALMQRECLFTSGLTTSDSFILMVILLTASVALLIIFRKPAPLRAWVLVALGNWRHRHTVIKYLKR